MTEPYSPCEISHSSELSAMSMSPTKMMAMIHMEDLLRTKRTECPLVQ